MKRMRGVGEGEGGVKNKSEFEVEVHIRPKKIGYFACALKAGKQKGEKNCVKLKYGCCG